MHTDGAAIECLRLATVPADQLGWQLRAGPYGACSLFCEVDPFNGHLPHFRGCRRVEVGHSLDWHGARIEARDFEFCNTCNGYLADSFDQRQL
jgi:hypothetical protein